MGPEIALRWVAFAIGVYMLLANWRSIITTIILPRAINSYLTYVLWSAVHHTFSLIVDRLPRYERKDAFLAIKGPIALITVLLGWIIAFILGYALLFMPFISGNFGTALELSGSSFFTLGIASEHGGSALTIEFLAAASGMIVIALQIGYLPTIYNAYNRREVLVTGLSARAGSPVWGPIVLAKHIDHGRLATLPTLFATWENWAADIVESHTSYPWLMVFRSPDPLNSWVTSFLAVLDAAALLLAFAPSQVPPEARQLLRTGSMTLIRLSQTAGEKPLSVLPTALHLPRQAFHIGAQRLIAAGLPVENDEETAWTIFTAWRVHYEQPAMALAEFVVAVPAPWSGKRAHMTRQEAFEVLTNPIYRNMPDDPQPLPE